MHKAIREYDFGNFKWEVIYDNIPKELLNLAEICAIYLYDSDLNGYNMSAGGEGQSNYSNPKRKFGQQNKAKLI